MEEIIRIAEKEIGSGEKPLNSNKTKYGKWFGLDGVAWCGMFVSWCYAQAGFPLPNIGFTKGFAGCQTAFAYFKKNKMLTKKPVPGDIVLFDWNRDNRYDHTGIFVKWIDENTFESIEGNTAFGNDSNGGTVMRRSYRKKSLAVFVHLDK
jgi:hypothetical protein